MFTTMKKLLYKLFGKLIKKAINRSVTDVMSNDEVDPAVVPMNDDKKNLWKFILQTFISILTAILTALGATSCMGIH
jgi:hypothetical protein